MSTILYRLPEEKVVHELHCSKVVTISSLSDIGHQPGYMFAPFSLGGQTPTLLFVPDEERAWMTPNRFSARHIEYVSDEARRRQRYQEEFAACQKHLQSGELDKIVLSRGLRLQMDSTLDWDDLQGLFIVACHRYPHSFISLISMTPEGISLEGAQPAEKTCETWLIATPEVLLEEREGTLRTMALAATMSIEEAAHLKPSQWSDKNREEQRIVADYIASRLSDLGIKFSQSAVHTKIAGQLVHLCTDFTMEDTDEIGKIIAALHPTPAICGLPAKRAYHLLREIERHDRRYYAGFSGPIRLDGGTHLFVTLRCMALQNDNAMLYAGGGLLAASECESEWVETQRKLKTMLNVLQ